MPKQSAESEVAENVTHKYDPEKNERLLLFVPIFASWLFKSTRENRLYLYVKEMPS